MKKTICALLVLITFSACSNKEDQESTDIDSDSKMTFTATFDNDVERAHLNENQVVWDANDGISVFAGKTGNSEFTLNKGDENKTKGTFTGELVEGNALANNYAIYPYQAGNSIDESGVITTTLPATQTYNASYASSFGVGANTMVAVTNGVKDKNLQFKNACGYLKLKLYNTDGLTVQKIVLEGNANEKIAGSAKITASSDPSVEMQEDATTTITLNCGNGVALGNSKDNATEFRFVVPPITGFKVTIYDNENNAITTKSTTKEILRNKFTNMAAFEVKKEATYEYVDLGLSVLWATKNIGAKDPEDAGDYFSWGYTTTRDSYESNGYNYPTTSGNKFASTNDAATVIWGAQWRTPTKDEVQELIDNVEITVEDNYLILTSKKEGYKSNYIILPNSGYKYGTELDETSTPHIWCNYSISQFNCSCYYFSKDESESYAERGFHGVPIRAVRD